MTAPRASIVTVCYGKRELTERCLASLTEALGPELGRSFELVLVDNASPDDTAELLRSWQDRATVLLLPENLNYAGGNNRGVEAARGEVIVFLNNDTVVVPGALEALVEDALDPTVGMAGLRLLYPDRTIQHGGVAWCRKPDGLVHAFHLFIHEAGDLPPAQVGRDVDVVTAACMAMRRELFQRLGGFDEGYANGYEDVDLCFRTRVAGLRVRYRGDRFVYHDESATRGRFWNMAANDRRLRDRWGALLEDDSEQLAAVFDARVDTERGTWYPSDEPFGSRVSVEGQVSSLAPEAAEARALLAALESAGHAPAARDWHETFVGPRLAEYEHALLVAARRRPRRPGAAIVHVPAGAHAVLGRGPAVLRVGRVPEGIPAGTAVWAASKAVADELVGVARWGLEVVPPPLPQLPLGPGGAGALLCLPAHDLAAATAVLDGWAGAEGPIRVLPSVATPELDALVGERLPAAEILGPVTSELRFAALASGCDVVVSAGAGDPFQRRALLAAAVGAVVVAPPGGPAAEALGDALAWAPEEAAERIEHRAERAALVAEACGRPLPLDPATEAAA